MLNLPNAITLTRIALVVVFTAAVSVADRYSWGYLAALVTFILAACTDWLDGYLARRLNQVTTFGKLIDPLADKIAVSPPGLPFSSSAGNSWSPDCARLRRIMASSSLRERPANGKPPSSWPSASPACWP